MSDANGPREMREVGTASHAHMLTGIDQLAGGGVREGAGPAPEPAARLDHCYLETPRCQRGRRRQPRQAAADDEDALGHRLRPTPTGPVALAGPGPSFAIDSG